MTERADGALFETLARCREIFLEHSAKLTAIGAMSVETSTDLRAYRSGTCFENFLEFELAGLGAFCLALEVTRIGKSWKVERGLSRYEAASGSFETMEEYDDAEFSSEEGLVQILPQMAIEVIGLVGRVAPDLAKGLR